MTLGSLVGALGAAMEREEERIPAIVTFVTAASGVSLFGIGAAFWGLLAGGVLLGLLRIGVGAPSSRPERSGEPGSSAEERSRIPASRVPG